MFALEKDLSENKIDVVEFTERVKELRRQACNHLVKISEIIKGKGPSRMVDEIIK
ncbi:MAG: hypothetical protein PV340_01605 [Wolbachia sp.]|nr:hypothetical protein [Wolbachia sp.]MDD9336571.1 hypothetical protein [Wolbachia sp.]